MGRFAWNPLGQGPNHCMRLLPLCVGGLAKGLGLGQWGQALMPGLDEGKGRFCQAGLGCRTRLCLC